jgi:hypothetical protein
MAADHIKILNDNERQPCEIWTRVMGYIRPVSQWNIGKKGEYMERRFFSLKYLEDVSTIDAKEVKIEQNKRRNNADRSGRDLQCKKGHDSQGDKDGQLTSHEDQQSMVC